MFISENNPKFFEQNDFKDNFVADKKLDTPASLLARNQPIVIPSFH